MNLKEALLSFDGVIDNEYLDQYVELVSSTFSFSDLDYTERHHVIPVAFYRAKHLCSSRSDAEFDFANKDTRNKLAILRYRDHCLAHWLLTKCTSGILLRMSVTTFMNMTGDRSLLTKDTLHETFLQEIQEYRNELREESDFFWSAWQDQWLIENRATKTFKECAEFLGKPEYCICTRCRFLGLIKRPGWTTVEEQYLRENYGKYSIKVLSEQLSRSYDSVAAKANALELTKASKYTPEQEAWLKQNYIYKYSLKECAKHLNRTMKSITAKVTALGIAGRPQEQQAQQQLEKEVECKKWLIDNYRYYLNIRICADLLSTDPSIVLKCAEDLNLPIHGVHSWPNRKVTKIRCINTGEVFYSATAVCVEFKLSSSTLYQSLKHGTSIVQRNGRVLQFEYGDT
jgi:hypothetical protein